MTTHSFRESKFQDCEIVDEENKTVAHIRIKPNKILYSPAKGKGWYGVSLEAFAKFAIDKGEKLEK